jgi:hypothetical protein
LTIVMSLGQSHCLSMKPVILIACLFIIVWLLVSRWETQRALQWWQGRQSAWLHQEAESIRNGLLQEAFILRRSLEMSRLSNEVISIDASWLPTVETFHQTLADLSDRLSPPYLDESLPLAIKSLVNTWNIQYSALQVHLNLPPEWYLESYEQSLVILTTLSELVRIAAMDATTSLQVVTDLVHYNGQSELKVEMAYPDRQMRVACMRSTELNYLRRVFPILSTGKCFQQQTEATVTWYFRWRPRIHVATITTQA